MLSDMHRDMARKAVWHFAQQMGTCGNAARMGSLAHSIGEIGQAVACLRGRNTIWSQSEACGIIELHFKRITKCV